MDIINGWFIGTEHSTPYAAALDCVRTFLVRDDKPLATAAFDAIRYHNARPTLSDARAEPEFAAWVEAALDEPDDGSLEWKQRELKAINLLSMAWDDMPLVLHRAHAEAAGVPCVVLVGCGKTKLDQPALARRLYTGNVFRARLEYADRRASKAGAPVAILSGKHGVIDLDELVEPYNVSLGRMRAAERKAWGVRVWSALCWRFGRRGYAEVHAGAAYVDAVRRAAEGCVGDWRFYAPMQGKMIGQQLRWYSQRRGG